MVNLNDNVCTKLLNMKRHWLYLTEVEFDEVITISEGVQQSSDPIRHKSKFATLSYKLITFANELLFFLSHCCCFVLFLGVFFVLFFSISTIMTTYVCTAWTSLLLACVRHLKILISPLREL